MSTVPSHYVSDDPQDINTAQVDVPGHSDGVHRQKKPIYVMVLGPSGSGKSSLINAVSKEKVSIASPGSGSCTAAFRFSRIAAAGQYFRLVDSPGFTAIASDNQYIFKQLVLYLLSIHEKLYAKLSGIIYLHPDGSDLGCDQLKRTIGTLRFLLGDSWMPRVTIAVVKDCTNTPSDGDTVKSLQGIDSPFYPFHSEGARIQSLSLDPQSIEDMLGFYQLYSPQKLHVQTKWRWHRTKGLETYIEEGSKTVEEAAPHSKPDPRRSSNRNRGGSLKSALDESQDHCQQLELTLKASETEVNSLQDQLEQTRSEYASLRSELQLSDNMEQSQVVKSLKTLNRSIENFGRHIAEHVVDNHVTPYSDDDTTLKALNLAELKAQFHHSEGSVSLVISSNGAGLPTEDFFDLAVRSIVCKRLYESIFLPFHPTLADSPENRFMDKLYKQVRFREHQTISAKWRANAFLALSDSDSSDIRVKCTSQYAKLIAEDLECLFGNFFGKQAQVPLTELQNENLNNILLMAWDWNDILKGSIVVLGDFQPTVVEHGVSFDPDHAIDFEPNKKSKKSPDTAVCTIGFGLTLSRSRAKGSVPEETIVCKTCVVTEQIYD